MKVALATVAAVLAASASTAIAADEYVVSEDVHGLLASLSEVDNRSSFSTVSTASSSAPSEMPSDMTSQPPSPAISLAPSEESVPPCQGQPLFRSDEKLYAGREPSFICSPNGEYRFGMESDGDLSLWRRNLKLWSASTCCVGHSHFAVLTSTGNLVVVANDVEEVGEKDALWASGPQKEGAAYLRVRDDGKVQILSSGTMIWELDAPSLLEYEPFVKPVVPWFGPLLETPKLLDANAYRPGHLTNSKHGLLLSAGLDVRIIARSGRPVPFSDGSYSAEFFHTDPDHAATFSFPDDHPTNPGGWVYASNAEGRTRAQGGVGSLFFNREGQVIDYKMILSNTVRNCGGGKTPWGTWISCEEKYGRTGHLWETDPLGVETARKTVLGGDHGGQFESFCFDIRDANRPRFFYTEDNSLGPVRRFTPSNPDWNNTSAMLHGDGTIEYLVFTSTKDGTSGRFQWTSNERLGSESANQYFPNTEGIDHVDGQLFIVSKKLRRLFQLDLDKGTFTSESTKTGAFKGGPDQLTRLIGNTTNILYYTEDGSGHPGVHARDSSGRFFMVLESIVTSWGTTGLHELRSDETTGVAFSPNLDHLYVAYQKNGLVFDIWRKDGKNFAGRSIDIKYHSFS